MKGSIWDAGPKWAAREFSALQLAGGKTHLEVFQSLITFSRWQLLVQLNREAVQSGLETLLTLITPCVKKHKHQDQEDLLHDSVRPKGPTVVTTSQFLSSTSG